MLRTEMKIIALYLLKCIRYYKYSHSNKKNAFRECNKAINNIYVGAMQSTIYTTCVNFKSRDCYQKRIDRPNIENAAGARASGSFWSKYLVHKKIVLLILLETLCCS